ncbi:MAG: adenosylmethionine--8-amino-7-oxononanoate transaminase [Bacteroidetes bacterium]|nr:adenosylmethionine--8-amino-7-oxononanoate transaminase [Bacteroidota bacterium]
MQDALAFDHRHIWHPFTYRADQPTQLVTHGSGPYLHTAEGRRIFDAISSWWVNLHGHAHPEIAQAVAAQAARLEQVIFAGFTHEPALELIAGLQTILHPNFSRFFFSDNGSTAVEVALKMSLQYFHNLGEARDTFVAFRSAYHGDTFGAMSVSARGTFTAPFQRQLFQVSWLDDPDNTDAETLVSQLQEAVQTQRVAALIVEPLIMGSGGMRMYSADKLALLAEVAHMLGIHVIFDEVFTGFGRTGELFAHHHIRQLPDFLCLSKGLTGGFLPMGLTVTTEEIHAAFQGEKSRSFLHGHSFTANPMACATAIASLRLLTGEACTLQRRQLAQWLEAAKEMLEKTPGLHRVRRTGCVLAMEVGESTGYLGNTGPVIYDWCLAHDVLIRPLGNTIYLVPPYVSSEADIQRATAVIRAGMAASWQPGTTA